MKLRVARTSAGSPGWDDICAVVTGAENASAGAVAALKTKVHHRSTFRLSLAGGRSVIVKVWRRSRLPAALYRAGHPLSTAYREWRMPHLLREHGIVTAAALAYFGAVDLHGVYVEAVVMEDLGECRSALSILRGAVKAGDRDTAHWVEQAVVDITGQFVSEGFVDTDHRLANFIVASDGAMRRLDLEHCRYYGRMGAFATSPLGRMLGTLIGTYAFVVQPDVSRAQEFASRVLHCARASRRVTSAAQRVLNDMMARQKEKSGIDTRMKLSFVT